MNELARPMPKPTAQAAPYVEVLGAELAITFILTFGGSQIYLAADPGGRSAVERLVGHDRAKAHGEDHRLQMVHTVPLARKWLVLMLAWQGQSHAQIARSVRVATSTVRRYVKEAAK